MKFLTLFSMIQTTFEFVKETHSMSFISSVSLSSIISFFLCAPQLIVSSIQVLYYRRVLSIHSLVVIAIIIFWFFKYLS